MKLTETVVCPRCFGTGSEDRIPAPYTMPIQVRRKVHPPCHGCNGLGFIPITYYRKMQYAQKLARKLTVERHIEVRKAG